VDDGCLARTVLRVRAADQVLEQPTARRGHRRARDERVHAPAAPREKEALLLEMCERRGAEERVGRRAAEPALPGAERVEHRRVVAGAVLPHLDAGALREIEAPAQVLAEIAARQPPRREVEVRLLA